MALQTLSIPFAQEEVEGRRKRGRGITPEALAVSTKIKYKLYKYTWKCIKVLMLPVIYSFNYYNTEKRFFGDIFTPI